MLGAFLDDSGTQVWSPVTVVGGLLGSEEQWGAFTSAWHARLARPLPGKVPIGQFHLSPCRGGNGEFRDYEIAEREHVARLFRRIVLDIDFITIAVAVNRVAWDELVNGHVANLLGTPLDYCFTKCIDLMVDAMRVQKPKEKMFIFVDQETKTELEVWANLYKLRCKNYPEIAGMGFAPASTVVALQGADMIATESQHYGLAWLRGHESSIDHAHFSDYLQRDLSVGLMIDRDHIEEMVAVANAELAKR
jgi:hypothetical protein